MSAAPAFLVGCGVGAVVQRGVIREGGAKRIGDDRVEECSVGDEIAPASITCVAIPNFGSVRVAVLRRSPSFCMIALDAWSAACAVAVGVVAGARIVVRMKCLAAH